MSTDDNDQTTVFPKDTDLTTALPPARQPREDETVAYSPSDLQALVEDLPTAPAQPRAHTGVLTGRVQDTHNPDLPGRVFVRWVGEGRRVHRAWLLYTLGSAPRCGDSVLLVRPDNDPQWLVSAVLAGPAADKARTHDTSAETLRLQPGQRLRIESHDGTGLVEVGGTDNEVSIRLLGRDVALEAQGRLRLAGTSVQVEGGAAGIDVRSEQEVVVRGRNIRLN